MTRKNIFYRYMKKKRYTEKVFSYLDLRLVITQKELPRRDFY